MKSHLPVEAPLTKASKAVHQQGSTRASSCDLPTKVDLFNHKSYKREKEKIKKAYRAGALKSHVPVEAPLVKASYRLHQ